MNTPLEKRGTPVTRQTAVSYDDSRFSLADQDAIERAIGRRTARVEEALNRKSLRQANKEAKRDR